jgi:protein SCO1/2
MSPTGVRRFALVALGVALGVAVGVGARFFLVEDMPGLVEIKIGGPFALTDHNGQRRTEADFRGRLMLLAFGYTNCPDVCPLDLQLMADALDKLGPAAQAVQPVFVTVDPKRDTAEKLKSYVTHFSPRLLGLTGNDAETAAAAKAFRVYYKLNGDPAKDSEYSVDHSAFIFLMGRDGKFLASFSPDTPVERLADTLRQHL